MYLSLRATLVALFWGLNLGLLLFCTKMYLLIKDTLFVWARAAGAAPGFFASYKSIYPAALVDKAQSPKNLSTQTGTKAAFVKCTFY
jgi:hypothetical protein